MKTLKFKVTLLSDVILNICSASEGNQQALDFIPGNNFLGICAKELYTMEEPDTYEIFHSGKVRFGDAHLGYDDKRGVKIPAVMHYPKLDGIKGDIYLSHLINNPDDVSDKQLKQCREGFYVFESITQKGYKICAEKNFAIKSAHDSRMRTSKEGKMYGYESIQEGTVLYFTVEVDNDRLADKIEKKLVGTNRLGRSRTAQYGQIQIETCEFADPVSVPANGEVTVYADGRLIFIDEDTLLPTFRPTARQLGIDNGDVLWNKCQIKTFQYSPWNFHRQCFDTDRCGIEKGSVFVIKTQEQIEGERYVGSYNNEGFGKIIYNPEFLSATPGSYFSSFKLDTYSANMKLDESLITSATYNSPLMHYLSAAKKQKEMEHGIYAKVNNFVKYKSGMFKGSAFASQWGSIRTIALSVKDKNILVQSIDDFLSHGVAKDKWEEQLRKDALMQFLDELQNDDDTRLAIINLASEMQKKCRA